MNDSNHNRFIALRFAAREVTVRSRRLLNELA